MRSCILLDSSILCFFMKFIISDYSYLWLFIFFLCSYFLCHPYLQLRWVSTTPDTIKRHAITPVIRFHYGLHLPLEPYLLLVIPLGHKLISNIFRFTTKVVFLRNAAEDSLMFALVKTRLDTWTHCTRDNVEG